MSKKVYLNGPISWAEARDMGERRLQHVDNVQKRAEDYLVRKAYARAARNEAIAGTLAVLTCIIGVIAFLWVL